MNYIVNYVCTNCRYPFEKSFHGGQHAPTKCECPQCKLYFAVKDLSTTNYENIAELARTNTVVHQCLKMFHQNAFESWEHMLTFCVVTLVEANEKLKQMLTDDCMKRPLRIEVTPERFEELKGILGNKQNG